MVVSGESDVSVIRSLAHLATKVTVVVTTVVVVSEDVIVLLVVVPLDDTVASAPGASVMAWSGIGTSLITFLFRDSYKKKKPMRFFGGSTGPGGFLVSLQKKADHYSKPAFLVSEENLDQLIEWRRNERDCDK